MKKINTLYFLYYNLIKMIPMHGIVRSENEGFVVRGCLRSEIKEAQKVYRKITGRDFSRINKVLLKLFSDRNLILAVTRTDDIVKIVGINFYYVNNRDFKENTVHEGFIGVLPEFEGQGIATKMRISAKSHFRKSSFFGISSRVSKNNLASLRSAEKMQFEPVEEYFDNNKNEERYYLICDLGDKK